MIPAGELRHRIEILNPPTERDSRGRRDGVWRLAGTASAKIEALSGTEAEVARQQIATATHRVTLRVQRQLDLTTANRFRFRGRLFNIGFIDNVGELNCDWVCTVSEERA